MVLVLACYRNYFDCKFWYFEVSLYFLSKFRLRGGMVNFDHSPYFSLCMGSVTIPDLFVFGSIQFLAIIFRKSSFSHIYLVSYLYYIFSPKCILSLRLILSCIYIPTYTYIHTYTIHYFHIFVAANLAYDMYEKHNKFYEPNFSFRLLFPYIHARHFYPLHLHCH